MNVDLWFIWYHILVLSCTAIPLPDEFYDAGRNSNSMHSKQRSSGQEVKGIANNSKFTVWAVFLIFSRRLLISRCCVILDLVLHTSVFFLVEIYMVLGKSFVPYLGSLSSTQLRLVTIYANRISQVLDDILVFGFSLDVMISTVLC